MRQTRAMREDVVLERLAALAIETPSWGYGNSGTRFHVYPWPGAARTVWERIDDAALVHRLTGCCPSVALHIPWDRVEDWSELLAHAGKQGIRIGAINPNLFGDDEYRLGSLCHPDARVRERALEHAASASRSPRRSGRRSSASGSPTGRTIRAKTICAIDTRDS
jgi:L-rhamnose isomerase / sugar isomerase